MKSDKVLQFFSDGGARPTNPGPTSWAYVQVENDKIIEQDSGFLEHGTNNIGEILGPLHIIRNLPKGSRAEITTDSAYVVNSINTWCYDWFSYGPHNFTADKMVLKKKSLKNAELFRELHFLRMSKKLDIKMIWVKGHSGNKFNEICDEICTSTILNRGHSK